MSADPDDRRAKVVTYTDYGAGGHRRTGATTSTQLEQRFVAEFGEDDYETARRVLERVVEEYPRGQRRSVRAIR